MQVVLAVIAAVLPVVVDLIAMEPVVLMVQVDWPL